MTDKIRVMIVSAFWLIPAYQMADLKLYGCLKVADLRRSKSGWVFFGTGGGFAIGMPGGFEVEISGDFDRNTQSWRKYAVTFTVTVFCV